MTSSPALRFAMVTTFYPPFHFGGDGQAVRRLAHALARRGHRVDIIHDADAFRSLHRGPEPVPVSEPPLVRVHRLESRWGALSCLATQQIGRPLVHGRRIRRILSQGYDVIHFHNVSLVGGPGILEYGDAIKLYTAHEHWLVCPSHILWRHNREICDRKECLRCVLRHRRPPQLWRFGSLLERKAHHVDAFVGLSQFSVDKHRQFGFDRPFRVLPSFLPDSETETGDAGEFSGRRGSTRPYFLFVGRLEAIKGLQDVIPLFTDDAPAELWIAGSGTYETALRGLAHGRSAVQFLGQLTQDQLRGLYRKAAGVVIPSRCFEVFPMVVLEAFREGTPIVARRLGPFPEIVSDSNGGVLFETPSEMRAALWKLAADVEFRQALGQNGRRAFETRWHEDVAMREYFDLILAVARERGNVNEILGRLPAASPGVAATSA